MEFAVNAKKQISAVIVAYNGMDFIDDCLNSLKTELAGYVHEIIVIDNHSADGTAAFIAKHHADVKLIENDGNFGFARAMNQGIDVARYEFLWLLNQDIRIRPGCIVALRECYERLDRPGVIGPRLIGFDGRLQRFCRRFPDYHHLFFELTGLSFIFSRSELFNGWKMGDFDHLHSRPVDQPMGAAMFLARSCLDEIGVLDESFGIFFNDVDFCRRLHEAGFVNYYCTEAIIEHYGGGSVSRHKARMVWLSHIGMFRYLRKWERRRKTLFLFKILNLPSLYLSGLLLVLTAIPRSLYYYCRSLI